MRVVAGALECLVAAGAMRGEGAAADSTGCTAETRTRAADSAAGITIRRQHYALMAGLYFEGSVLSMRLMTPLSTRFSAVAAALTGCGVIAFRPPQHTTDCTLAKAN